MTPLKNSPTVFSQKIDFLLLLCPIWISISYFLLIHNYQDNRTLIFFIYLFLLGEIHFASTWLFFTNKDNRHWALNKKISIFFIPAILIFFYILIGLNNLKVAIFLGSLFSSYHVIRQSIGIFKLFGGAKFHLSSLYISMIWIFSIGWLLIGFARFFLPWIFTELGWAYDSIFFAKQISILTSICLVASILTSIFITLKSNDLKMTLATLTGIYIYSAYSFVDYPQDAVVMGVGIHWCQYIALTGKLYLFSKNQINTLFDSSKLPFLLIYSLVFASIQTNNGSSYTVGTNLLLLPLAFQAYHYYLDAFIWRFSDPYLRSQIAGKLLEK